jgi:hypothetical protein
VEHARLAIPARRYVDTLAITREQWLALLDEIDASRREAPACANRRRMNRAPCREVLAVFLDLEHPSGAKSTFLVRPRDISKTGLGFIHGAYIHPTSKAELMLVLPDRELLRKRGSVARCRHIRGKVHEVGVAFDEPFTFEPFGAPPAANPKTPAA